MKLNYLFSTNAVLLDGKDSNKVLDSHTFRFLGQQLTWHNKIQGSDIVLEVNLKGLNFQRKIATVLKFAALVVYRNSHVENFQHIFSSNASVSRAKTEAAIEPRFLVIGNEDSFSPKLWSMLSFYLEAKNSLSIFYKFICLYKITEIENLGNKLRNGKNIIVEDAQATKSYIDKEIPTLLTRSQLNELNRTIKSSSVKQKTIGEYSNHLFRDAFSHTGFLEKNDYKYGYPTINPFDSTDINRYNSAIDLFEQLAKKILRQNEPKNI